jgi:hypothetical protein
MLCFVLINAVPAGHSALGDQLTPAYLGRVAAAMQLQMTRDVAPYWPGAAGAVVRVGSDSSDVGAQETPVTISPTLADAPGAIAFHDDEADGIPDEFLGLDTCSTLDDVSSALSHENAEVAGDPECDQWTPVPAGLPSYPTGVAAGQLIATELSDPVQDRSYPVDLGDGGAPVMVSDFCLPSYFTAAGDGPTTFGETLGMARVEPFGRSPGGYQLVQNADGSGETQAFGDCPRADRLRAGKHATTSRPARRGVKRVVAA